MNSRFLRLPGSQRRSSMSGVSVLYFKTRETATIAAVSLRLLAFATLTVAATVPAIGLADTVELVRNINTEGREAEGRRVHSNNRYAYVSLETGLFRSDGVTTEKINFRNTEVGVPAGIVALSDSSIVFWTNENDASGSPDVFATLWQADVGREHRAVRILKLRRTSANQAIWFGSPGTLQGEHVITVSAADAYKSLFVTTDQGRRLPNRPLFKIDSPDNEIFNDIFLGAMIHNNRLFVVESLLTLWMYQPGMSAPALISRRQHPSYPAHQLIGTDQRSIFGSSPYAYFVSTEFTGEKKCELWRNDGTEQGTATVESFTARTGFYPCPEVIAQVDNRIFYVKNFGEGPRELWTASGDGADRRQLMTGLTRTFTTFYREPRVRHDAANSGLWMIVPRLKQETDPFDSYFDTVLRVNEDGTDPRVFFEDDATQIKFGPVVSRNLILVARQRNSPVTTYYSIDMDSGDRKRLFVTEELYSDVVLLGNKLIYLAKRPRKGVNLHSYNISSGRTRVVHRFRELDEGSDSGRPMVAANGYVYFCSIINRAANARYDAIPQSGFRLWRSDGSRRGTNYVVRTLGSLNDEGVYNNLCGDYAVSDDRIFYVRNEERFGNELWRSGALHGKSSQLLADIRRGRRSSDPRDLRFINNRLVFTAVSGNDSSLSRRLFVLTNSGETSNSGEVRELRSIKDAQIIGGDNRQVWVTGTQGSSAGLWRSNGTRAGTRLITTGFSITDRVHTVVAVGRKTYLYATVNDRLGLYVVDAASRTPRRIAFNLPENYTGEPKLITHRGQLYAGFSRNVSSERVSYELWRINPETERRRLLFREEGYSHGFRPMAVRGLASFADSVYMSFDWNDSVQQVTGHAATPGWGWTIRRTDNDSRRTTLIHTERFDYNSFPSAKRSPYGEVGALVPSGDTLFFFANSQKLGAELWKLTR